MMITSFLLAGWMIAVQSFTPLPGRHHSNHFLSPIVCQLNRFLFDQSELDFSNGTTLTTSPSVTLPKDDYRTLHAAKILSLKNGATIRCGIVGYEGREGMITDTATVEWKPEGKVKKAERLNNGEPPGSLRVHLLDMKLAKNQCTKPPVSLILALPRPLQLGRMLPMISQMGVETLVLTTASKVPKDYFGSHLFRKPDLLRDRLIEGLCQAGDVRLPPVRIVRNLTSFLDEEVDELFPSDLYARVIAHPQRLGSIEEIKRVRTVAFPDDKNRKMVVAVGPEGGWQEPEELDLFQAHGFQQVTMGSRVLRSDCAVVSLLSLAHDACS